MLKLTNTVILFFLLLLSTVCFTTAACAEDDTDTSVNLSAAISNADAVPRVYFKDFRSYPIHRQNAQIPDELMALDGKEIQVIGYMVPFDRIENITQFILLQAPFMGCMHVPPPGANETLMIETERPLSSYTYDPLRITGTLSIDEVYVDGYLISVYTISGARVQSSSSSDAETEGLPDNFHFYGDM